MRNLILIILLYSSFLKAQTTAIPDPNFEQALINLGLDNAPINGSVPTNNIDTLTYLDVSSQNISSIVGIEDFTSLTYLNCSLNTISTIDISQNTALTDYYCASNSQTSINVTQNINLTTFHCASNNLTSIDVTQNTALLHLYCTNNQLINLDVTQNILLKSIQCHINSLTTLDVTKNIALEGLSCHQNQLTNLDVTQNPSLTTLHCLNNQLTSLDVSQNLLLNSFHCSDNQISSLNLSQNSAITYLHCANNLLSCLNVKNGNNINFSLFRADNNPNLTCIEVDDTIYSNTNWNLIDTQSYFNINCNNPCSTVGIEETTNLATSFYPNPTTGIVNIDLRETKSNLKATLLNSLGQVVYSKNYQSVNYISLNIEAPKGIYFLQLESEGEIQTLKILKE